MEDDEGAIGCMSCMKTDDLCDLFAVHGHNSDTYTMMFETCFNMKISNDLRFICKECATKLENAFEFKEQTTVTINMLLGVKDEEYLDESLLDEEDGRAKYNSATDKRKMEAIDVDVEDASYNSDPGSKTVQCDLCSMILNNATALADHLERHHGVKRSEKGKQYPCHFCDNVYSGRKACYTHLRMKHGYDDDVKITGAIILLGCLYKISPAASRKGGTGSRPELLKSLVTFVPSENDVSGAIQEHALATQGSFQPFLIAVVKLSSESTPKPTRRERKSCHICRKDFSQKQILNKHLWKEHGYEVEKRKAYICPLCDERVSYGSHFERHLLMEHRFKQRILRLEFKDVEEFTIYKNQIQEETRCRFRKTTASKPTIEGLRSHYMCSQSGMYVYQGKGIRPAPERQIYKTGKACPAHMVVTQTVDRVLLTFYMTHVGHGACPYYVPREPRKPTKLELDACMIDSMRDPPSCSPAGSPRRSTILKKETHYSDACNRSEWICDTCGVSFMNEVMFRQHTPTHGHKLYPCQQCDMIFQDVEAWSCHFRSQHNLGTLF